MVESADRSRFQKMDFSPNANPVESERRRQMLKKLSFQQDNTLKSVKPTPLPDRTRSVGNSRWGDVLFPDTGILFFLPEIG